MTRTPPHRPRIRVFGQQYYIVRVVDEVNPDEHLVLYRIKGDPDTKRHPRVATLADWIEWDRNAQRAKLGRQERPK